LKIDKIFFSSEIELVIYIKQIYQTNFIICAFLLLKKVANMLFYPKVLHILTIFALFYGIEIFNCFSFNSYIIANLLKKIH